MNNLQTVAIPWHDSQTLSSCPVPGTTDPARLAGEITDRYNGHTPFMRLPGVLAFYD